MLNKGVKEYGFDSWKNWFVFNSEVKDEEIKDELREIDIIPEGHGTGSPYDCTGRVFRHSISIKRGKFRTLVTQYCGIDC